MAPNPQARRGWTIGRLFGARVLLQPSTLVMIAILALFWGTTNEGELTGAGVARGAALALLLFGSVFIHEAAHAAAARAFRREVKAIVITIWGGHTTFDANDMTPRVAGWTAAAGPLANAAIGFTSWCLLQTDLPPGVHQTLAWLTFANFALAIFNALPGIPMDGGRVLEAIVWAVSGKRTRGIVVAAWGGRVVSLAFLTYVLSASLAEGETLDLLPLLWGFFIFSMLWPAAGAALRAARMMDRIEVLTVARMMHPAIGVDYRTMLADAMAEAEKVGAEEVIVMSEDGSPAGHFTLEAAADVPQERRAATSLSAVTLPIPRGAIVAPDLNGPEVLAEARPWWGKSDILVVVDENTPVGVVRLAELSSRLQ